MIKRLSFVWKRPSLSDEEFRKLWLGQHAALARRLANVRDYRIDFIADAPPELPSGIASLRFDNREELDSAFANQELTAALYRTRDQFASRVEVFLVDEVIVASDCKASYS